MSSVAPWAMSCAGGGVGARSRTGVCEKRKASTYFACTDPQPVAATRTVHLLHDVVRGAAPLVLLLQARPREAQLVRAQLCPRQDRKVQRRVPAHVHDTRARVKLSPPCSVKRRVGA